MGGRDRRRHVSRTVRSLLLAGLLVGPAGCGYHLRGKVDLPDRAQVVKLSGIAPGQPFAQEFTELLTFAGGRVTPNQVDARTVFHVIRGTHQRRQISLSKAGKANGFNMTYRLEYEVTTPKGEIILPREELEVSRQYYVDIRFPLGQGEQETLMRTEMEREAAQTVMRRLRSVAAKPRPDNA